MLFYLGVYALATTGTFAALAYLGQPERQIDGVDELAGLGRTHPWAALGHRRVHVQPGGHSAAGRASGASSRCLPAPWASMAAHRRRLRCGGGSWRWR